MRGIAHKDLPSIFLVVCPKSPISDYHPSDEDLQMNCDASETPPCVPTSDPPTLSLNGYFPFLRLSRHSVKNSRTLKGLIKILIPFCIGLQKPSCGPITLSNYIGYLYSVGKDAMLPLEVILWRCMHPYLKPGLAHLLLYTSLQAVAVQVHTRSLVTKSAVFCCHLTMVESQQDLDTLVDQLPYTIYFVRHFNETHSTLWGSRYFTNSH
ncbi:hypothetical protein AVEN_151611-1 [Araneus ventricosus]|uniref:Uncharacterized protein n=1 Tax=Araneus ventricosus TaxID=182803 RepID=A0A4Y2UA63_ARAVE|nr:hypothetical protein AVEN_151611-1 [Araneus ventricosus]